MENVSVLLLIVLGLASMVMIGAVAVGAYAWRIERKYHADRGLDLEATRLRAGSSSSDVHVIVRFAEADKPADLVAAIGGVIDIEGLRGVVGDLIEALPRASDGHVSCAHFHDIKPYKIPGDATHIYVRVRTRKPIVLPEGTLDRRLIATVLDRCAELDAEALVEATARVVKPSSDPASARLVALSEPNR